MSLPIRLFRSASATAFHPSQRLPSINKPIYTTFVNSSRGFKSTVANMGVHNIPEGTDWKTFWQKGLEGVKFKPVVVIDAFATWCGPCKVIAPVIAKWSEESIDAAKADTKGETGKFHHVTFLKLDVDELPVVAQELGVHAMPTFVIFKLDKEGNPIDEPKRVVGANPAALAARIDEIAGEAPKREHPEVKAE